MIFISIQKTITFAKQLRELKIVRMHKKVEEYIDKNLNTIAILDEAEVGFEDVEILEYRTHHENGDVFKNQKDELYAIAILNAITSESAQKITREIKKNKNLSVTSLRNFVEKHYLKCFVPSSSDAYDLWKTGDKGVAFYNYDDVKKTLIPGFNNQSAEKRK